MLEARFDKPAQYFLCYGNTVARKPNYDITRFEDKIPVELSMLKLGDEQMNENIFVSVKAPLFENKIWL